ncbi:hypothetical protein [Corynebacterium sp. HMSC072A04]|uniref:hypothetical protein n=1 Tax=Corynebacterium sp. HMSC072A04 TaxID=1715045 RepID=UPI0008ADB5CD|nr:hypothetical protein [Corynebacterium sp. HMSC072A04]OFN33629.1 hypothetical protein HMPREF2565_11875 [Corynebacterium sp. HMSC072A04]
MSRWKVSKIGVMWSAEDYDGRNYELFHQWDEAMHYVDHMTRTIKIHIPSEFSFTPAQLKQIETLLTPAIEGG